jgi:hypothetical protein
MALTMTRTRTQTTLTKLAELVANVHGELAFLEEMLQLGQVGSKPLEPSSRLRLEAHLLKLRADREALYITIQQFDPAIDPQSIGRREDWRKRIGVRRLSAATFAARYAAEGTLVLRRGT